MATSEQTSHTDFGTNPMQLDVNSMQRDQGMYAISQSKSYGCKEFQFVSVDKLLNLADIETMARVSSMTSSLRQMSLRLREDLTKALACLGGGKSRDE